MDIDLLTRLATLAALLLGIVNLVWGWLRAPGRETNKRIDELETKRVADLASSRDALKEHDRRIQQVESDIRHLPTKDGLHEIAEQLVRVETELETMGKVVTRIDDYLRERK